MGRFITEIAAAATRADNLPPSERLPSISVMDALLPRHLLSSSSQTQTPIGTSRNGAASLPPIDVTRDKNGKLRMVRHRASSNSSKINANTRGLKADINGKVKGNEKTTVKLNDGKTWTAEEDRKLKQMKADGETWAKIAEALGKSGKSRWQEINKDGAVGGGGGDLSKGDGNTKTDGGDLTNKDNAKIKELLQNNLNTAFNIIAKELGRTLDQNLKDRIHEIKRELGAGGKRKNNGTAHNGGKNSEQKKNGNDKTNKSNEKSKTSPRGEAKFTLSEWRAIQEDDMFSLGELQLLIELMLKGGEAENWLLIASRFFEKTGRRVHPEDIREKFEQMNAMGG